MLQKRLDYGFNGYHVPFVPRAARSARRRGMIQKKVEDDQLCAFDLLATVAGEILLEGEKSHKTAPETVFSGVQDVAMDEDDKGNQSMVVENCEQESVEAASPPLTLELGIRGLGQDLNVNGAPAPTPDAYVIPTSVFPLSSCMEKNVTLSKIDLNGDFCSQSGEIEGLSLGKVDSCVPLAVEDVQRCVSKEEILLSNGCCSHNIDSELVDGKSPTLVSSDGSVKLTLGNGHYPCNSHILCKDNNVNVVSRDDDENSSECIQHSTMKTGRLPARRGDRRIRKLFTSKYWKKASKAKDGDLSDTEGLYRCRKTGFKRPRSQRIYPFKRRRLYHYSSLSNYHAEIGYKGVYNCHEKSNEAAASGFGSMRANSSSACVAGQSATFSPRESHVKLRIKSFRVPELFIEMPDTATVGSLKRTVMEAVSALLGGGLRVGVLLQGKKIRDDNRTLLQSGISRDNKADLGFSLEPTPLHAIPPVYSEENSLVLTTDVPQPLSRFPATASIQHGISHLSADHMVNNMGNFVESEHDSAPSPADLSTEKGTFESCALVSLPNGTPEPLSVSRSHQKSKRSDMSQRRIRRPFSVTEVEALVEAVEKLGTGRWRDVKLRAFDNVKHRTYVDLKDKWKTLVHTARIAPQQRRGEPVPQVLLDRVLAAHAFWTQVAQHQSKQELKQPPSETCLLL